MSETITKKLFLHLYQYISLFLCPFSLLVFPFPHYKEFISWFYFSDGDWSEWKTFLNVWSSLGSESDIQRIICKYIHTLQVFYS